MASPDRRRPVQDEPDTDEENDDTIDPELRLRTVRTAASTIAESVLTEARIERRKTRAKKRLKFFKRSSEKKKASPDGVDESQPAVAAPIGKRRNIYVNSPLPPDELDSRGEPVARYVRNKVRTTSAFHSYLGMCSCMLNERLMQNIPSSASSLRISTNSFVGACFHLLSPFAC